MTLLAINSIWYIIPNSLGAVENSICYFLLFLLTSSSKTTVKFAKRQPNFHFLRMDTVSWKKFSSKKKNTETIFFLVHFLFVSCLFYFGSLWIKLLDGIFQTYCGIWHRFSWRQQHSRFYYRSLIYCNIQ